MAAEQYDVSEKMQKLFREKQKQRAAAKDYYMKILYNPHRPLGDPVPYDSSLQRFTAMSSYHIEHFKPKPASYLKYFFMISPVMLVFFGLRHSKRKEEELLRSGVVRYEDRKFKYCY